MTRYRRIQKQGGYYFFTVVTYQRRPFLVEPLARSILRSVWQRVRDERPFDVVALCLLPDHLHCIWRMPENDGNYSIRWSLIKRRFTQAWLSGGGMEFGRTESRKTKGERCIWQRRFWEHRIRDESDLARHVDYTHYNPVKHGLVEKADHWEFSTYTRYLASGKYANKSIEAMQNEMNQIMDLE
jgi:putative transposase